MTGAELKKFREDLGDVIGRRMSTADMARLFGMAPKNGADTYRKWEDGDGPTGPVSALISIFSYGVYATPLPIELRGAAPGHEEAFGEMIRADILRRLS